MSALRKKAMSAAGGSNLDAEAAKMFKHMPKHVREPPPPPAEPANGPHGKQGNSGGGHTAVGHKKDWVMKEFSKLRNKALSTATRKDPSTINQ